MQEIHRAAPWVALISFAAALLVSGVAWPGFSQLQHPVALPGAVGAPHALVFNLGAFVLPGALLAWRAIAWRSARAEAGWPERIGLQLLMLSAMAFAAQGLLPLDPSDLRAPASRLHAAAWTAWWLAFLPGALTVAFARRRIGGGAPALLLLLLVSLLVPLLVLGGTLAIPAPLAQRLAVLAWFTWWIVAGRRG